MRRDDVRVVAASTFTAGALAGMCRAAILPPGLSQDWFDKLVTASTVSRRTDTKFQLVTAFRLADWRDKGLPEILTALRLLGRSDVRLTVCGTGKPSLELEQLIGSYEFCSLRSGLNDAQLAAELASADLFVLATRTRPGHSPCGEGFGLVLLEAQVAGTPVVAPASGGSRDAFIEGVTGAAPIDESRDALAQVFDRLLREPHRLTSMGARAAAWSRERFAPESYAERAVAAVL
jgi:glycosyltransferase involved in cell wall biosynthesis